MSDKCSVNHVFNSQLKALRSTLLPQVMEHWDELTDVQKEDMRDMGNFFCRMHILVNMALECDKTLGQLDNITQPAMPQSGESGAGRLVRTSVKALHTRGCEQSGAAADFLAFLQEKERLLMLVPYKGIDLIFYSIMQRQSIIIAKTSRSSLIYYPLGTGFSLLCWKIVVVRPM